ncbi:3297_t:CDS:2 [Acaulospora morrowiae]|uniref:3297_t:CDS:1 n=1 Tax=Acaulospora morrowiae TaxID=94023 RepID=A0A9N9BR66_9GLOM|nr:3297_t:CDS:2 [Acaulospora morrowiae]
MRPTGEGTKQKPPDEVAPRSGELSLSSGSEESLILSRESKREVAGVRSTENKTEKWANELTVIMMEKQKMMNKGESQLDNENCITYPSSKPLDGNLVRGSGHMETS